MCKSTHDLLATGTLLAAENAFAQLPTAPVSAEADGPILVTAARSILPAGALPLTIDVIDKDALD